MITIDAYDYTQPSIRKAWKDEFHEFLIDYYRPSLINADKVFKAIGNVDAFIKKHAPKNNKLLSLTDTDVVKDLQKTLLSHRSFAMGGTVSANDYRVIVIERYFEFLTLPGRQIQSATMASLDKDSEESNQNVIEGMMKEVLYFRRKRNRAIRNQCAEKYKYTCQICGFNFEKTYGEIGKGFIEVHHLKPMASYDKEHDIKLDDLIALCPNCHSMIHIGGDLKRPKDLRMIIDKNCVQ